MLVPCRNCGKEVGEIAEVCFHCGTNFPNKKNKFRNNIQLANIIVMATLLIKYDDWFKKEPILSGSFQVFVFAIFFINLVILSWLIYKAITDYFK